MPRPPVPSRPLLVALAVCLALLGCTVLAGCGGASGSTGTFTPQPDFLGNNDPDPQLPNPGIPQPSLPGSSTPSAGTPSSGPSSVPSSQSAAGVVATKLVEPTGLVVLPDGTALVGERRSGRIYRVQPNGSGPATLVQTLAGVDGSGDGGLLDLAISPSYYEDGLIYAYLTTATDNRVVHFPLGSAPSTVIGGIPRGRTGNTGRIAFDATGALLTGTGDAGDAALAAAAGSLAGKVLRTDDIGTPQPDNPDPASPVYARGLIGLTGLCVDPTSGTRLAVADDRIQVLSAGTDYAGHAPAGQLPATLAGGGGCALAGGRLLIATAAGQALATGTLKNGAVGTLAPTLVRTYGRLRTVVVGPDGAIWLTTRNRDGHGSPVPDDDRVIRLTSMDSAGSVV